MTCERCQGALWVCEAHHDQPWPHQDGPGEPCPACNTTDPPRLPNDWVSLVVADALSAYMGAGETLSERDRGLVRGLLRREP
jgi:hypothetical protein